MVSSTKNAMTFDSKRDLCDRFLWMDQQGKMTRKMAE